MNVAPNSALVVDACEAAVRTSYSAAQRGRVLYLRVDEHTPEFFREAAVSPPLNYEKGGQAIDLAFWRLPDRLLDEPDEFIQWARAGLAAAHRVASKSTKHSKRPLPLGGNSDA